MELAVGRHVVHGNFKAKPWLESSSAKKPDRSAFVSGNQKFDVSADSISVSLADGGKVTFKADGSVVFRTFDGKQDVKM